MDPFSVSSGLAWLAVPGRRKLPSGVTVDVGSVEGGEVTVVVGGGACVVVSVDATDDPPIQVSVHWVVGSRDAVTRAYDSEAVVCFDPDSPRAMTIRNMPAANHQRDCAVCPLDPTPTLVAGVEAGEIENFLGFVARLPRVRGYWRIDPPGTPLWRGRTDGNRHALIELVPPDDSDWRNNDDWRDRSFEVIASVPVPFDTWPHNMK